MVVSPVVADGRVEEAGEGLGKLIAVGGVDEEVTPEYRDTLEAMDGSRRETTEDSRMRSSVSRLATVTPGWLPSLSLVFLQKISPSPSPPWSGCGRAYAGDRSSFRAAMVDGDATSGASLLGGQHSSRGATNKLLGGAS